MKRRARRTPRTLTGSPPSTSHCRDRRLGGARRSGTPVGVASTLSAASDADKGVDAWGTPFSIHGTEPLVEDDAATQLFMELLGAGADGEAGTNDDIAFWVSMTGEFTTARTRTMTRTRTAPRP